jgi:hypothetical protein
MRIITEAEKKKKKKKEKSGGVKKNFSAEDLEKEADALAGSDEGLSMHDGDEDLPDMTEVGSDESEIDDEELTESGHFRKKEKKGLLGMFRSSVEQGRVVISGSCPLLRSGCGRVPHVDAMWLRHLGESQRWRR